MSPDPDNTLEQRPPRILVFDSGLGGMSVLKAIRQQHSFCHYIYVSDNAAFPYGTKTEQAVTERVAQVLQRLEQRFRPDILVIACNTASTVALPRVRSLFEAPVIGVVPAIKPAGQLCQTRYAGLLATPGTIQRTYTQTLIDQFAPTLQWIKVGSSELVEIAEQKMAGVVVDTSTLERIRHIVAPLAAYRPDELDSIVLACTHFPLLRDELQQVLPGIKQWIDSSEAIANRVGFWLHELGFYSADFSTDRKDNILGFTKPVADPGKYAALMTEMGFATSETV